METHQMLYPLTQPQKRIWYTQMIYPSSPMFNIGGSITVRGQIDVNLLKQAISAFVNSHDAFSIRLTTCGGEPMQYFHEERMDDIEPGIELIDFSGEKEPESYINSWINQKAREPFILEDNPLYCFAVFIRDEHTCGYLVKLHHIIADGWSMQMLTKEISRNYSLLSTGDSIEDETTFSYMDFIKSDYEYLQSPRYRSDRIFWNNLFNALPEEKPRTSDRLEGKRKTFHLSRDKTESIHRFCSTNSVTVNALFISLYLLYVNKRTGINDIVIGTPVLGRIGRCERQLFGMTVGSIPFRYTVEDECTFLEMIGKVNSDLMKCFLHQKYPYNHLVRDLNLTNVPLYTACVNYYSTEMCRDFRGFLTENMEFYNGEQEYSHQLIIRNWSDMQSIQIDVDYKTAEYTQQQIEDMFHQIGTLMDQAFVDPDRKISEFCLLGEEEKKALLNEDTIRVYFKDKTVVDLFREQVELTPERVAVRDGVQDITYALLDERSDHLAAFLRSKGITGNTIVGLLSTHSPETIVGILGILKAGGAYLPIDPQCPVQRMSYMLSDCVAKVLLTNMDIPADAAFSGIVVRLDDADTEVPETNILISPEQNGSPDDPAYVIYTSGSTGKPKGVMIEHHSLLNYIYWAKNTYVSLEQETFPLYSSLAFDLTATSIFTPLISGGTIVIYRNDTSEYVVDRILRENRCTIMKLTPAHLVLLKDRDNRNSCIGKLIVGGENLSVDLARDVYDSFGGNVTIYNEYGPTEATVGCMIYRYNPDTDMACSVPIGCAVGNTRIYVMDKNRNPVPVGIPGEIYISGEGIARGYLNQPELTAMRFVENPYCNKRIMYRTGDMAKYNSLDCVDFIGRIDDQVKINGYRIELEEIEHCLREYRDIDQAIVVPISNEMVKAIYAYYISKHDVNEHELRTFLKERLPEYMIPAVFIRLESFPLTINVKIDKSLLPKDVVFDKPGNKTMPGTPREKALALCVAEVLGTREMSMDQSFFFLGGDSIKAIQISSRLKEDGYFLSVKDMLSHPVLGDMVAYMEESDAGEISQDICKGTILCTPIIRWFFEHGFDRPNEYCQSVRLKLKQFWDVEDLQRIIHELVVHHDSLRINYDYESNVLFYNNDVLTDESVVEKYDLRHLHRAKQTKEMRRIYTKLIAEMNIEAGILLRSCVFRLGETEDIWLIVAHHLSVDGVSWRILLDDIQSLMEQMRIDRELHLPMKTRSYQYWADCIAKHARKYDDELVYWEQVINKCFVPTVYRSEIDMVRIIAVTKVWDEEITGKLLTTANNPYHTRTDELLIAALTLAIRRISGSAILMFELENHGRNGDREDVDISRTVGWFTAMYPVCIGNGCGDLDEHIKSVKEEIRKVPSDGAGFGQLDGLHNKWSQEHNWIRFNYLGDFRYIDSHFTLVEPFENNECGVLPPCLLEVNCIVMGGRLTANIRCSSDRFDRMIIEELAADFYQKTYDIVHYCCSKQDITFTPSDFKFANLTQDELDQLFD